ncbi:MAG: prepilin-type N-terminal cleavage/methylation domain-containing protein [Candidatus Zixiibacteriota bacterium]
MMPLRYLKNSRGVTLVELIVALAISSILLVAMVSASIFVQKFVTNWQQRDSLAEELAFVRLELAPRLSRACKIRSTGDTIQIVDRERQVTTYSWRGHRLTRDDRALLRPGFQLTSLRLAKIPLREIGSDTIFGQVNSNKPSGLYELWVAILSPRDQRDSLRVVVRNDYEYFKNSAH